MQAKISHIGWDVDDVLLDCRIAWIRWNERHGFPALKPEDFKTYGLHETLKCSKEEAIDRCFRFLDSPEILESPACPNAVAAIRQMSHIRHSAITGRPQRFQHGTARWIQNRMPVKFQHVCAVEANPIFGRANAKAEACQRIGAQLLVEDAPLHVPDCLAAGIIVLLVEKLWNQDFSFNHPNLHRIQSTTEVPIILRQLGRF